LVEQIEGNYKYAIAPYQYEMIGKMAPKFNKEVAEIIKDERRAFFLKTIGEDEELRAAALDFKNADKEKFGQRLLDKFNEFECKGKECKFNVVDDKNKNWSGLYDGNIHINKAYRDIDSLDDYMSTAFFHEGGHRVDYANPEMGALGKQAQEFGTRIYQSYLDGATRKIYRANLTEQSSRLMQKGAINFEAALKWRYGNTEQKFEAAESMVNSFVKEHPVATVTIGAATTVGVLTTMGEKYGILAIIDKTADKENKTDTNKSGIEKTDKNGGKNAGNK